MSGTAVSQAPVGGVSRSQNRPFVLLTTDFKPAVGGIAELLHQLAEAAGQGARTLVYSTVETAGARFSDAYEVRPLPPLPTRDLGERFGDGILPFRKFQTARFYRALAAAGDDIVERVLRESPSDAELCVGQWTMETDPWCAALARRGRPYSLFAYGLEIARALPGRLADRRRRAFTEAARVYAISRGTAALLRDRLGCVANVRLIQLGIDVENVPDVDPRRIEALRRELAGGDATLLLTVGRLVRRKGVDLVLEAIASLGGELPRLHYAIAGSGPEREPLRLRAAELGVADRVHFLGSVDEDTKRALYAACDIFVMPNRLLGGQDFEGFGFVFLEAALAGKPTIGGANGGVPDAVLNGETGVLIDPEVPGALAAAIRRLTVDRALARRLGEAGRERVRRAHGMTAVRESFAAARLAEDAAHA